MRKIGAAVFFVAFLLVSAIHSAVRMETPQTAQPLAPLFAGNAEVATVFQRSCANCHSDETRWPWYSYVPPASWLVLHDVENARRHFNASEWRSYDGERKSELMADVARVVANREMPLRQYLVLHAEARLSDKDAQTLVSWARNLRRSLRAAGPKEFSSQ